MTINEDERHETICGNLNDQRCFWISVKCDRVNKKSATGNCVVEQNYFDFFFVSHGRNWSTSEIQINLVSFWKCPTKLQEIGREKFWTYRDVANDLKRIFFSIKVRLNVSFMVTCFCRIKPRNKTKLIYGY